ncbi:LysR family transcriptional regulator [Sphingomonas sp. PAMC 26621]|uniref:LysR family transcriptional regulator n=1 Tax=Sphingomonas sp. PAMC 26621 TaxID=1112213 RepID=UPI00028938F5|nr:LysR family transcriptional regulator [Sphingomonas sp. PAMC 26621]
MTLLLHALDAGSLSKAARELGLPLATVSHKVSELEAHLGAILVIRSSKGLVPTPTGRSYVAAAKAILEQVNEAERAAAGEYVAPRGELAITAPVMFGRIHTLPVIIDFLRAYPDVGVSLTLSDRIVHLVDDHIDIALRIGDLPDSGLTAACLGSVRRVVCASPAYLAERGVPATPQDLAGYVAISLEAGSSPDVWRFAVADREVATAMRARIAVNSVEAAIDAALSGMGLIRVLSYQVAEQLRRETLVIVLDAFEPAPVPVHLLYDSQARPLKLRAFIDFASPRLRERLAQIVM